MVETIFAGTLEKDQKARVEAERDYRDFLVDSRNDAVKERVLIGGMKQDGLGQVQRTYAVFHVLVTKI